MVNERTMKILSLSILLAAVTFVIISSSFGGRVIGAAGVLFGIATYRFLSRTPNAVHKLQQLTVYTGLVQVFLSTLQFMIIVHIGVIAEIIAPANLTLLPSSMSLTTVGILLGSIFGGGLPLLVQEGNYPVVISGIWNVATVATFIVMVFSTPSVVIVYVLTYSGSRLSVLLRKPASAR